MNTKDQLPPLPEPDTHCFDDDTGKDVWSYSADQMHAYALAALAQQAQPVAVAGASLLRQPVNNNSEISKTIPGGCYCPPGICQAPIIMGRQTPCMRRDTTPPAPQPAPVDAWLPIESAPKERGARFIGLTTSGRAITAEPMYCVYDGPPEFRGWHEVERGSYIHADLQGWMPLPKAPKTKGQP